MYQLPACDPPLDVTDAGIKFHRHRSTGSASLAIKISLACAPRFDEFVAKVHGAPFSAPAPVFHLNMIEHEYFAAEAWVTLFERTRSFLFSFRRLHEAVASSHWQEVR